MENYEAYFEAPLKTRRTQLKSATNQQKFRTFARQKKSTICHQTPV